MSTGTKYWKPESDEELERTCAEILARFEEGMDFGRPVIMPPGVKVSPAVAEQCEAVRQRLETERAARPKPVRVLGSGRTPESATRQAILCVNQQLLETLTTHRFADEIGADYGWLVEALKLPPGTRITGVSQHLRFFYGEVAIRVAHPDFVETPPGYPFPVVNAVYNESGFLRWEGPALRKE